MRILIILFCFILAQESTAQPLKLWENPGEKKIINRAKDFELKEFGISPSGSWWIKEEGKGERIIFNGKRGPLVEEIKTSSQNFSLSEDGRHIAYKAEEDDKEFFVIDSKKTKPFKELYHPVFSLSGHIAYRALRTRWMMITDKTEGPEYDFVGMPVWSPDGNELSYEAQRDGKEIMVRGAVEGKMYDLVSFPLYSSRGDFVYAALERLSWRIVHDAVEDTIHYGYITFPTFSSDGNHFLFNAQAKNKWFVVRDGVEGKKYEGLGVAPVVAADGSRIAYRAMVKGKWIVVDNENESPVYDDIDIAPVLSENARHIAFAAKRGRGWFVVLDGKELKHFDNVRHVIVTNNGDVAYQAWQGDEHFLVVNGKEYREEKFSAQGDAMFSPDQTRCGVAGVRDDEFIWFVVDVAQ